MQRVINSQSFATIVASDEEGDEKHKNATSGDSRWNFFVHNPTKCLFATPMHSWVVPQLNSPIHQYVNCSSHPELAPRLEAFDTLKCTIGKVSPRHLDHAVLFYSHLQHSTLTHIWSVTPYSSGQVYENPMLCPSYPSGFHPFGHSLPLIRWHLFCLSVTLSKLTNQTTNNIAW
jgi:hypothetical protein